MLRVDITDFCQNYLNKINYRKLVLEPCKNIINLAKPEKYRSLYEDGKILLYIEVLIS